jgi:hypothetical protein
MAVAHFGGAGRYRRGRLAGRAAVSAGYLDNALCLFKPFEMLAASESNWRVPDTEYSGNTRCCRCRLSHPAVANAPEEYLLGTRAAAT